MLSILIPTYNYNVYPLVNELYNQCTKIKNFTFEIIVNDDASKFNFDNQLITKKNNCFYYKQNTNQGLSASRNFLIQKASHPWCLFLDDDVWPTTKDFIENYIKVIETKNNCTVFFGGLEYTKQKPKKNELLRWIYGNKHEALSYKKRLKEKPKHFLSSNVVISKSILNQFSYATEINSYGYEDLIFNLKLIENKISILQINNPAFHEKLDNSEIFLNKTEKALENLSKAIQLKLLNEEATGISKLEKNLKKLYCKQLFQLVFKLSKSYIRKNIVSNNPNLILFNLYRLGYFCTIHK